MIRRGWTRTRRTRTPHGQPARWPAPTCDCFSEKSLIYWKCHSFWAASWNGSYKHPLLYHCPNCYKSADQNPFLPCVQGTGQMQRCRRWGRLLHLTPTQTLLPGFCTQDKGYHESQRLTWGWAGELIARSFEALTMNLYSDAPIRFHSAAFTLSNMNTPKFLMSTRLI